MVVPQVTPMMQEDHEKIAPISRTRTTPEIHIPRVQAQKYLRSYDVTMHTSSRLHPRVSGKLETSNPIGWALGPLLGLTITPVTPYIIPLSISFSMSFSKGGYGESSVRQFRRRSGPQRASAGWRAVGSIWQGPMPKLLQMKWQYRVRM